MKITVPYFSVTLRIRLWITGNGGKQVQCAVQGGTNICVPSDLTSLAFIKYIMKSKVFFPAPGAMMWCSQISHPLIVHFIHWVLFAVAQGLLLMQLAGTVFYKEIHCIKRWHPGEVQGMFEEKVKQDETFTPGWGVYVSGVGGPSCPGGAGTAGAGTSPKGNVCMGQVFPSDTEHRKRFSDVLNFMRFSYQDSFSYVLK